MGKLPPPLYSKDDIQWVTQKVGAKTGSDLWYRDPEGKLLLPEDLGKHLILHLHQTTHLGEKKMGYLLETAKLRFHHQRRTLRETINQCHACQVMKSRKVTHQHSGRRERGWKPGVSWEIDFTEVRPGRYGCKYLLVLVGTFSGWAEALPTKRETASVVAKKIGSDNGPAFVSKIMQGLSQILGTDWKLHCEYNPQSSGQVEKMNRSIKETLSKLAIETGGDWVTLLPYALFQVRNTPYVFNLMPFEILYGGPPPRYTPPDQNPRGRFCQDWPSLQRSSRHYKLSRRRSGLLSLRHIGVRSRLLTQNMGLSLETGYGCRDIRQKL